MWRGTCVLVLLQKGLYRSNSGCGLCVGDIIVDYLPGLSPVK